MAHHCVGHARAGRALSFGFKLLLILLAAVATRPAAAAKPAAVATLLALMNGTSTDFQASTVLCLYLAGARLAKDVVRSYDPTREVKQIIVADDTMPQQSLTTLQGMGVHILQHDLQGRYPFPGYLDSMEVKLRRHGSGFMPVARFDKAMLLKAVLWRLEEYAYILFHDLDVFFDSPPKPESPILKFVAAAMGPGSENPAAKKPLTEFWFHEDGLAPVNAGVFLAMPAMEIYYSLEDIANMGVTQASGWGGAGTTELQLWDEMKNTRCKNQDWFGSVRPLVLWERQICEAGHTKIWAFASAQCEQGFLHYVFNHLRKSGERALRHEFGNFYHFAGGHKAWNLYNFPYFPHNSWMSPGIVKHHLRIQGWFWDRLFSKHKERMFPATDPAEPAGGNVSATCRAMFEGRFQEWTALRQKHNITWVDGWDWKLWPDH